MGRWWGSPWAAHGAGRWNDGGWRRRGEEVNLLWSSCRRLSAVPHASRCGAFRPSFHRLLSRPVTLADSWGPLGPLGDPLGTLWGALGKPVGNLGNPRGFLGDPLGTTWRPQEMSWGPLGTPWRSLGDHLPGFLVTLGASWGSFGGILDLQGAPIASPRGSRRPLGGLLGSFWRLRKCL